MRIYRCGHREWGSREGEIAMQLPLHRVVCLASVVCRGDSLFRSLSERRSRECLLGAVCYCRVGMCACATVLSMTTLFGTQYISNTVVKWTRVQYVKAGVGFVVFVPTGDCVQRIWIGTQSIQYQVRVYIVREGVGQ